MAGNQSHALAAGARDPLYHGLCTGATGPQTCCRMDREQNPSYHFLHVRASSFPVFLLKLCYKEVLKCFIPLIQQQSEQYHVLLSLHFVTFNAGKAPQTNLKEFQITFITHLDAHNTTCREMIFTVGH